ncbi:hypothetical protein IT568_03145 [bacterium]|nr:hypothetical protein [bacterium]
MKLSLWLLKQRQTAKTSHFWKTDFAKNHLLNFLTLSLSVLEKYKKIYYFKVVSLKGTENGSEKM